MANAYSRLQYYSAQCLCLFLLHCASRQNPQTTHREHFYIERAHNLEKEKTSHLYRRERHHDWDGVVRRRRPRAGAALSAHAEAAPPAAPPPEGRTEHDEQRASRAACSQREA